MTAETPILIAGAGIGGLATALALAKRGLACHVIEKRARPSEDGAGIQIGPNGVHVLRQLGVADALSPLTASPDFLRIMDAVRGRELASLPLGKTIAARFDAPYWTAHRADLHAALLAGVQSNPLLKVSLGAEVIGATSYPSHARVSLSNGAHIDGPALIAADGLWSGARNLIFMSPPLQDTGSRAYRTVIPASQMPGGVSATSTHIWLGPRAHVVHYPVRAGTEIALVAVFADGEMAAGWSNDVAAADLNARFSQLAGPLRDVLMHASAWRGWRLLTLPNLPEWQRAWVNGRIALLGDAAHPVLPFLAQGAVMALEDAVVIAGHIARALQPKTISMHEALTNYAAERRPRTDRVALAAQRNGKTYHLSGAFAAARNTVLRSSPPQRLLARYDWLYGWRSDPRMDQ